MVFSPLSLLWLGLAIVFGVLEAVTVALVSIWFVLGAVAALIASLFTSSFLVQFFVFVLVSGAALAVSWPLMKKRRNARPVPTNADLNVGRTATIIEPVTPNQPGRARLDGVDWTARSSVALEKGQLCTVISVDGATLTVEPMPAPPTYNNKDLI